MKSQFAQRLDTLGTETAFAVSQDAAEYSAMGNAVYPFHLGDIDIPTPANIMDSTLRAMRDGKTGYNPAAGLPELRSVLAEVAGKERGLHYQAENIVIQPGGKPVIPKFIQALMNPGDGVLYPNPGYPIYESQIEFHGGHAIPYGFIHSDNGCQIDREGIENIIDNNTQMLIYNNYQNPIGAESNMEEMQWIAELAEKYDLWILSDEAYFKIRYAGTSKSIASLPGIQNRTVILYTFSKTYAMTGWRLGAAIGPKELMKVFTKLAINDESCTNHFIQYGGIEALTGSQEGSKDILKELKLRRDTLAKQLNDIPGMTLYTPDSTFYLFPDVTEIYNNLGAQSYEEFRSRILLKTGVSFCTREHFGTPMKDEERKYIRFAYSGISVNKIEEGIQKLKEFLVSSDTTELL